MTMMFKLICNALNVLWMLGLGCVGIAAVFFTVFLWEEINRQEFNNARNISPYLKEVNSDGYVALYNERTGKTMLRKLDWISHTHGEDKIAVYCLRGKRGFFDYDNGNPLSDAVYDKAWNFYEGIAAVEKNGVLSFINTDFSPAFAETFKLERASDTWPEAIRFNAGQCIVRLTPNSIGVIDCKGKWVIHPNYDYISELSSDSCRIVSRKGLFGLNNYNGETIFEPIYDAVKIPCAGVANVATNGYQKQISYNGTVIREMVFDDLEEFMVDSPYIKYEVNGRWGILRQSDYKVIIPALYSDIDLLPSNRFKAKLPDDESLSSQRNSNGSGYIVLDVHNNVYQ